MTRFDRMLTRKPFLITVTAALCAAITLVLSVTLLPSSPNTGNPVLDAKAQSWLNYFAGRAGTVPVVNGSEVTQAQIEGSSDIICRSIQQNIAYDAIVAWAAHEENIPTIEAKLWIDSSITAYCPLLPSTS